MVNGAFVEANNFASRVGFIIARLTMHGWTPLMLNLTIQNTLDFDLVTFGDDLVEISLGYFSLLCNIGVDPQDSGFWVWDCWH